MKSIIKLVFYNFFFIFVPSKNNFLKKFWNILVLLIFVNFMALPSIATVFDFEISQTNVVLSEEETHSSAASIVYEKTIPKTMNIHDFIKFFETTSNQKAFVLTDDSSHISPYLLIFSPPPES